MTVGDATTLLLTSEYALSPQLGVVFVLGLPPEIKATASGSAALLGDMLTARNAAVTLLVDYHFFEPTVPARP